MNLQLAASPDPPHGERGMAETLAEIARITGAAAFSAPTEQALDAVYDRLGSSIGYEEELREVTYAFAAGGFVLLVVAGALSALWFNRLP